MPRALPIALVIACLGAEARAEVAARTVLRAPTPLRNHVNVRIAAMPDASLGPAVARPTVCVEAAPAAALSFEACGNGSGFLHHDSAPEMAHFRARAWLARRPAGRSAVRFGVAAGFAEIQVAADAPGFRFDAAPVAASGRPSSEGAVEGAVEAAGPELTFDAQWVVPAGHGLELVASATAGVAYVPGAPALATPMDAAQPYWLVTVGAGW